MVSYKELGLKHERLFKKAVEGGWLSAFNLTTWNIASHFRLV